MKKIITSAGLKHFYEKGDKVFDINNPEKLFEVKSIDTKKLLINTVEGVCLKLSNNIKGHASNVVKVINKSKSLNIKIKYFDKDMPKVEKIAQGDWIDLRAADTFHIKKGEFKLIPLGVAMELPNGYEAHVAPRSSTFKNFKVIETNSFGCIDESYKGDNDQWFMPVYALEDTVINKYDRICQFRIEKKMPYVTFTEVETLNNADRGGHGSTGVK